MDSNAFEVRAISRVAAGLLTLIGATLLASVRLPASPAPGVAESASVMVVRKKAENEAAMAAAEALNAQAESVDFASAHAGDGYGTEVLLWVNRPGEIVFRNADRYQRCVLARNRQLEAPDCPSAEDRRRMVLDDERSARGA